MAFNVIITITLLYIFIKIVLIVKQDFKLKALEHFDSNDIYLYTKEEEGGFF